MILKSTFIFIIFLFSYNSLIQNFSTPSAKQNQNQENLIKAQTYLFELKKQPKNVIVGTSLACRIITDSLDDFYNLSFNGSSIFDGLELVLKSEELPAKVYIEMNFFLKTKSELLSNELYSYFAFNKAKTFKVFRWNEQPIGKFITLFDQFGYEIVQSHNLFTTKVRNKFFAFKKANATSKDLFYFSLWEHTRLYNKIPKKIDYLERLQKLNKIVKILNKRNVEIVFFEMPVDFSLINRPFAKCNRNLLKSTFINTCRFYEVDTNYHYKTTDGIHLNGKDSYIFTKYFKDLK